MPAIPVRPLRVDEVAAFCAFAKGWSPDEEKPPWPFIQAARRAASVLYALGQPSVGRYDPDPEIDALCRWVLLPAGKRSKLSIKSRRLAREPVADSFAFDDPDELGWDMTAWRPGPKDAALLNIWYLQALAAFRAAPQTDDPPTTTPEPATPQALVEAEPGEAMPRPTSALVHTAEEAKKAFRELIDAERKSTGYAGSRPTHRKWARAQKPFRVTNDMIDEWRDEYLTAEEAKKGRRPVQR